MFGQRRVLADELGGDRDRLEQPAVAEARRTGVDSRAGANEQQPDRGTLARVGDDVDRPQLEFARAVDVRRRFVAEHGTDGHENPMGVGVIRMAAQRLLEDDPRIGGHAGRRQERPEPRHRLRMIGIVLQRRQVGSFRFVDPPRRGGHLRLNDKLVGFDSVHRTGRPTIASANASDPRIRRAAVLRSDGVGAMSVSLKCR